MDKEKQIEEMAQIIRNRLPHIGRPCSKGECISGDKNSVYDGPCWNFYLTGCEGVSNDCWKTCHGSRYNKIKNEAVKQFANKLKENITNAIDIYYNSNGGGYYLAEDTIEDIDSLVKEMVGDTE